jgi:hypothetical protein
LFAVAVSTSAQDEPDARPVAPPAGRGAKTLFGGAQADVAANWLRRGSDADAAWKVEDGAVIARGGDIVTREKYTDFHLHVEFKVPLMPDAKGQARGNSGVFCQGRYEVQVLDSYGLEPGKGDCAAIYNIAAPLVNACRPPEKWQTYDILFRAPRFDAAGAKTESARVSVIQNGVVVHNSTEIPKPTWGETFGSLAEPGPIVLQDHGNTVKYRNIWIIPLPKEGLNRY